MRIVRVPSAQEARRVLEFAKQSRVGAALWRRAPGILRNNPDLLEAFVDLVSQEGQDARLRNLQKVTWRTLEKVLATEVDSARTQAVGVVAELLASSEFESFKLDAVPHLGALQSLAIVRRTRLEYVLLLIEKLHRIKRCHPQLGLGSGSGVDVNGRELSRLELGQAWALIANGGHLFGTFATEGALLTALHRETKLKDELLDGVDGSLRARCAELIDEGRMHRAFYVFAAWRVSRWEAGPMRTLAVEALKAYFERRDGHERLRWAYKRARQLAYDRIHYYSGLGGLSSALVRTNVESIVESLLERNGLEFHEHSSEGNRLVALLDAHDTYQQWAFFTSPSAVHLIRAHRSEFDRWWQARRVQERQRMNQLLPALFVRPPDWPALTEPAMMRFIRLELPGDERKWISESRRWEGCVGSNGSEWRAFVSPSPGSKELFCDIYDDGSLDSRCVHRIARNLAASCRELSEPGGSEARMLWRSTARFGARVLEVVLKPQFEVQLASVAAKDDRVGYGVLADTPTEASRRLMEFLRHTSSLERKRELRAVSDHLAAQITDRRLSDGPLLVFLAAVKIVETATQSVHRELDGLWAEILDDGVRWHVLEHKSGRGSGYGQLKKLRAVLRGTCSEPTEVLVDNGTASYATFQWPPVGDRDANTMSLVHRAPVERAFGW